jgi:hypothetical protein
MADDNRNRPSQRAGFSICSALYGSELELHRLGECELAGMVTSLRVLLDRESTEQSPFSDMLFEADASFEARNRKEMEKRDWLFFLRSILELIAREALLQKNRAVFRETQNLRFRLLERIADRDDWIV